MKTIIANAIFQTIQRYSFLVQAESCGFGGSRDDDKIADMIDLRELSVSDIQAVVSEYYTDALQGLQNMTISGLICQLGCVLTSAWITKNSDKVVWGYNHTNKYSEALRAGESTNFVVYH